MSTGLGVNQLNLTWVHRFNRELALFVSRVCYKNTLQTRIGPQEKRMMDRILGYEILVPVILVNVMGAEEKVGKT